MRCIYMYKTVHQNDKEKSGRKSGRRVYATMCKKYHFVTFNGQSRKWKSLILQGFLG